VSFCSVGVLLFALVAVPACSLLLVLPVFASCLLLLCCRGAVAVFSRSVAVVVCCCFVVAACARVHSAVCGWALRPHRRARSTRQSRFSLCTAADQCRSAIAITLPLMRPASAAARHTSRYPAASIPAVALVLLPHHRTMRSLPEPCRRFPPLPCRRGCCCWGASCAVSWFQVDSLGAQRNARQRIPVLPFSAVPVPSPRPLPPPSRPAAAAFPPLFLACCLGRACRARVVCASSSVATQMIAMRLGVNAHERLPTVQVA
jgi:hypothetical protein